MLRELAPLVSLALLLTACGGASSTPSNSPSSGASAAASSSASPSVSSVPESSLPDDGVLTYHFNDASVPPEYHRSETLVVTKDTSTLTIDSYGDVLATRTVNTPPEVWFMLGESLADVESAPAPQDAQGCTGGTGRALQLASGTRNALDMSVEVCGGLNEDVATQIDAYIAPARALFPSTEELAPVAKG